MTPREFADKIARRAATLDGSLRFTLDERRAAAYFLLGRRKLGESAVLQCDMLARVTLLVLAEPATRDAINAAYAVGGVCGSSALITRLGRPKRGTLTPEERLARRVAGRGRLPEGESDE